MKLKRLYNNWLTRRIGAWLAMLVVGALIRRLTGLSVQPSGRKSVKNKAR